MKLPKILYVAVENEGHGDDEYLAADGEMHNLAEDKPRTIGVYRLSRTMKVWKEVKAKA